MLSELILLLHKTYHINSKTYAEHGAPFPEECCAHLRILLHSNGTIYQKMLHIRMPQFPWGIRHDFKWWLMRRMLLPLYLNWYCVQKNTMFSSEQHVYPYRTFRSPARCKELCQEDAGENKMQSRFHKKVVSSCSFFAMKVCSTEANTTLSLNMAQPV